MTICTVLPVMILVISFTNAFQQILQLNQTNLLETIDEYDMGFVFFYSPESPHCQSIIPVLENVSYKINDSRFNHTFKIGIGKLNVDNSFGKQTPLNEYNIDTVPTIYWFNNLRNFGAEYTGDTELTQSFIDYIDDQISFVNSSVIPITYDDIYTTKQISLKEIQPKTNRTSDTPNNNGIVICVDNNLGQGDAFRTIVNSAFRVGIREIYYTQDEKYNQICNRDDDDSINVLVYKLNNNGIAKHEIIRITPFDGVVDDAENENEIKVGRYLKYQSRRGELLFTMFSLNTINLFTNKNEGIIRKGINTITILHHINTESPEYTVLIQGLSNIARHYRKRFTFMIGSESTNYSQRFIESFHGRKRDFPIICITSPSLSSYKIDKYRIGFSRNITVNDLIENTKSVLQSWDSNELRQYISTEEEPRINPDEDNLYTITGRTYENTINENKDIVMVYCSDRGEVCRKFNKRLKALSKRGSNNQHGLIGKVNPYENEIDFDGFNTLPGIVLFKNVKNNRDKREQYIEYKGKLIIRDIISFIKKNVGTEIIVDAVLDEREIKEEMVNELKGIDGNNRALARKLFIELSDPEMMELYNHADRDIVKKEEEKIWRVLIEGFEELNNEL